MGVHEQGEGRGDGMFLDERGGEKEKTKVG